MKVGQVELLVGGSRAGDCELDLARGRRGAEGGGSDEGGEQQRGCLDAGLERQEFDCWTRRCGQLHWSGRVSTDLFWKVESQN